VAKPGGSGSSRGSRPLETDSTRRVESQRFSWLSRKVLIDSRNDGLIRGVHDVVKDERPRWVAAQRDAGAPPDLRLDHTDLEDLTCLIVGDPGEGDRSQRAVALALPAEESASDLMVVLSDVVYPTGDVNEYEEKFHQMYAHYPRPIYALPGNHDWYDGLDGFMWHFCGAEPLPRVSYRVSSFPLREWLVRTLWRGASRPDRDVLLERRDRLWSKTGGFPPQPGPYWVMETRHLALVAIDTGVKGNIDHEQGRWLLDTSRAIDKPKVLLTGKPLYVDGDYEPCRIEWARGASERESHPTVDALVRDEELGYVVAIGGDIHNYQRYSIPLSTGGAEAGGTGRTVHYIVSGGGGAYMSETHSIPLAEEVEGPSPARPLAEPEDLTLYPSRGESLAFYAEELLARAPRLVVGALIWLAAAGTLGLFLLMGGWGLSDMAVLAGLVAASQLASSIVAQLHRRRRLLLYAVCLGALTVGIALFAHFHDDWGAAFSVWLLSLSVVLLPVLVLAIAGKGARGLAAWVGALTGLTLLTYLVGDGVVAAVLRGAAITVLVLAAVGAVAYGGARLRRSRIPIVHEIEVASRTARAGGKSNPGMVLVGAAFALPVLATPVALAATSDYLVVIGVVLIFLSILPIAQLLWLGMLQLSLEVDLLRRVRASRAWVRDHARRYMSERLGTEAAGGAGGTAVAVDPDLRRLFDRTYPRGRLRGTEPFHRFVSEIFDRDDPPLFKNFLELEVRGRGLGRGAELRIRAYGVSGEPPGKRQLVDGTLDRNPIRL
jgi:hypothetical protein